MSIATNPDFDGSTWEAPVPENEAYPETRSINVPVLTNLRNMLGLSNSQRPSTSSGGSVASPSVYDENSLYDSVNSVDDSDVENWLDLWDSKWDKSNEYNRDLLKELMAYNSYEAEKNRSWQKLMSDTSYQRAVADLKKAGINPLLAFQTLTGADTPSGAAASVSTSGAMSTSQNPSSLYSSLVSKLTANKQLAGNLVSTIAKVLGIIAYMVA